MLLQTHDVVHQRVSINLQLQQVMTMCMMLITAQFDILDGMNLYEDENYGTIMLCLAILEN